MNNVEWKVKGLFKADAEKVYDEINSLGDSYTLDEIVEKAKDEGSELHKCFTWDNDVAAEKWRKREASIIVSQLVVRTTTTEGDPVAVRVISKAEPVSTYAPTRMLVQNDTSYNDLLNRALAELKAFQAKYQTITELKEIFEMIDAVIAA